MSQSRVQTRTNHGRKDRSGQRERSYGVGTGGTGKTRCRETDSDGSERGVTSRSQSTRVESLRRGTEVLSR
jgi:hypothetical protein